MNVFRIPERLAKDRKHRSTMARSPQHNDVYIVEFPKSGITWLSTLLANVALIESGRSEIASYTAAHLFVPDIHVTRDIGPVAYDRPPVRMIKSHAEFNPNYVFVVYLVRHPLDVMKSFYRFNAESGGPHSASFEDFCQSESCGIPAWKRHVNSWLRGEVLAQRLHVCRYEDLLVNAVAEIEAINRNYGWGLSLSSIEEAARRSTMEKMKEAELFYKSRNPRYTLNFVGGNNGFEVSEEIVAYVDETCRSELSLLGYNLEKSPFRQS